MTEKLLQYIWQFQHYNRQQLSTYAGEPLQIIYPGQLNVNQGPDFKEARIVIGSTTLVGAIELHTKTSDWEKHKHSGDSNYKNVILHVVYQSDVADTSGLPLLELGPRIPLFLLEQYEKLMNNQSFIACHHSISRVKDLSWISWKERLVAERLMRKSEYILNLLHQSGGHWEETLWWMIARNFGIKLNSDVFEEIARSVPISILSKHKESIHVLEALLLGQAGLLNKDFEEAYPKLLQREYQFYQHKYRLPNVHAQPVFLRMRPVNFPTVRLAQLAMLVHTCTHLFSKIKDTASLKEVKNLLSVTANDYWHYHYLLDEQSAYLPKRLGVSMQDNIVINTIVPMLFAYGHHQKQEPFKQKALDWLEQTESETNNITSGFKKLRLANKSAFDSQSYIELKTQYCDAKRCLECSVGNELLRRTSNP